MLKFTNTFTANITPPDVNIFIVQIKSIFVSIEIKNKNIEKWPETKTFKIPGVMSGSLKKCVYIIYNC